MWNGSNESGNEGVEETRRSDGREEDEEEEWKVRCDIKAKYICNGNSAQGREREREQFKVWKHLVRRTGRGEGRHNTFRKVVRYIGVSA